MGLAHPKPMIVTMRNRILVGLLACGLVGGVVGGCSSEPEAKKESVVDESPAMKSLEQAEKDAKMAADRKQETDEASTEGK